MTEGSGDGLIFTRFCLVDDLLRAMNRQRSTTPYERCQSDDHGRGRCFALRRPVAPCLSLAQRARRYPRDLLQEANQTSLQPMRKKNTRRPCPPSIRFLQYYFRKWIETCGSSFEQMLPRSIYAVTAAGLWLKVVLLVVALSASFLQVATWVMTCWVLERQPAAHLAGFGISCILGLARAKGAEPPFSPRAGSERARPFAAH
jgi:hypothetical protein